MNLYPKLDTFSAHALCTKLPYEPKHAIYGPYALFMHMHLMKGHAKHGRILQKVDEDITHVADYIFHSQY